MKKPRVKTSGEVAAHVDTSKPVFVYRNLHRQCLSVQQGGIVRCHVDNIVLEDADFRVSKVRQKRVRETQSKNVHAKVRGMLVEKPSEILELGWDEAFYNPYKTDEFTDVQSGRHLKSAKFVDIDHNDGILTLGSEFLN